MTSLVLFGTLLAIVALTKVQNVASEDVECSRAEPSFPEEINAIIYSEISLIGSRESELGEMELNLKRESFSQNENRARIEKSRKMFYESLGESYTSASSSLTFDEVKMEISESKQKCIELRKTLKEFICGYRHRLVLNFGSVLPSRCYTPGIGYNEDALQYLNDASMLDEAPLQDALHRAINGVDFFRRQLDQILEENLQLNDTQIHVIVDEFSARNRLDVRMIRVSEQYLHATSFPNEESHIAAVNRDERLIDIYRDELNRLKYVLQVESEINEILKQ